MRRHRVHHALPILAATISLVAAGCASGDDDATETLPTSAAETTIEDIIRDAGQFDDTGEMSDEMSDEATGDDTSDAGDEASSDEDTGEAATATSTTAPAGEPADEPADDDDTSVTTQPSSGTTTPTSSTVPPVGSPATTTPPAADTTAPPTTSAPATTTPQSTTPPAAGVDAAAALAGLNAVLAEVELLDGSAELPLCPLDQTGAQMDATFDALNSGAFADAYAAVTAPLAIVIDETYGTMVTCDRFDGSFDNGIGLSAIAAPSDLQAFSEEFANPADIDGVTVTVTPAGSGNGGDFFHVCSVDSVDPMYNSCEVDWISGGLMVTAWMAGADAVNVDLAAIQATLGPRLDLVLTNLAQAGG